jgi:hypothetical protein
MAGIIALINDTRESLVWTVRNGLLTAILACHDHIPAAQIPAHKRSGRKPKQQAGSEQT